MSSERCGANVSGVGRPANLGEQPFEIVREAGVCHGSGRTPPRARSRPPSGSRALSTAEPAEAAVACHGARSSSSALPGSRTPASGTSRSGTRRSRERGVGGPRATITPLIETTVRPSASRSRGAIREVVERSTRSVARSRLLTPMRPCLGRKRELDLAFGLDFDERLESQPHGRGRRTRRDGRREPSPSAGPHRRRGPGSRPACRSSTMKSLRRTGVLHGTPSPPEALSRTSEEAGLGQDRERMPRLRRRARPPAPPGSSTCRSRPRPARPA